MNESREIWWSLAPEYQTFFLNPSGSVSFTYYIPNGLGGKVSSTYNSSRLRHPIIRIQLLYLHEMPVSYLTKIPISVS